MAELAAVGSLPYVDGEYNEPGAGMREKVDALIAEEMAKMKPRKDALSYLGPVPRLKFQHAPIAEAEYKRVATGTSQQEFDAARYMVSTEVADKERTVDTLQQLVARLETMLAHQDVRLANAELLVKYGRQAWLSYTQQLEAMVQELDREIEGIKKETHDLNVQRTLEQTEAGSRLRDLQVQWGQQLGKNMELAQACGALEMEVTMLRRRNELARRKKEAEAKAQAESGGRETEKAPAAEGDAMATD